MLDFQVTILAVDYENKIKRFLLHIWLHLDD